MSDIDIVTGRKENYEMIMGNEEERCMQICFSNSYEKQFIEIS